VSELENGDPSRLVLSGDEHGDLLYLYLAQHMVFNRLCMYYAKGWRASIEPVPIGMRQITRFGSTRTELDEGVLAWEEIQQRAHDNPFFRARPIVGNQFSPPNGGKLFFSPLETKNGYKTLTIKIQTSFHQSIIEIQGMTWFRGLRTLQPYVSNVSDDDQGWLTGYVTVKISHTFRGEKIGHPEMEIVKTWAEQMTDLLREEFDVESRARTAKEDLQLRRAVESQ